MTAQPVRRDDRQRTPGSVVEATGSFWNKVSRTTGRLLVAARYRLFQQHRHRRLVIEDVSGRPIVVLPDVFNPVLFKSGAFLAETLNRDLIGPGTSVLDMGTGTGVGAIAAAQLSDHVVAVDINQDAVRCARINALLNNLDGRIEIRHGDLFDALSAGDKPARSVRFDVVLFNPPYFHGDPIDQYGHAWRSLDVVERFAAKLKSHLTEGGVAYVVLSSDGESQAFLETFRRHDYRVESVAQRRFINETMTVYSVYPNGR